MEVWLSPDFDKLVFKGLLYTWRIQRELATTPSSFLKTYLDLGKTRLVTLCLSVQSPLYNDHDYFTSMMTNEFVRSTLLELGSIYYEVWEYAEFIRKESKRIKREVMMRTKERKKSILEHILLWSKENREQDENERKFFRSMGDIFEESGNQFQQRRRMEETLERKLWLVYERFCVIKSRLESTTEVGLPQLAGVLRRDITQEIALPDLGMCHLQIQNAKLRMKRAERKYQIWRTTTVDMDSRRKLCVFTLFFFCLLVFCYLMR